MWIFCGGMMRSGSTLQYQITAQLVEESGLGRRLEWSEAKDFPEVRDQLSSDKSWKVFKTHVCTDSMIEEFSRGNATGVYIYRDIRDAFVSHMTKASIDASTAFQFRFIEKCLDDYEKWTGLPNMLISQYEATVSDTAVEVSRIARHLGLEIAPHRAIQIADELSIVNQRARLKTLKSFKAIGQHKVDTHSLLHSNHIYSGQIGRWKKELSTKEINKIEMKARDWLASNGYALSETSSGLFQKMAEVFKTKK